MLVGGFVALLAAAVAAYPGGSWADPQSAGFDWLRNYWCDLIRVEALNGTPNGTARPLAQAACFLLAAGLQCYWRAAASLVRAPGARRAMLAAGALAALGVALVALLPHGRPEGTHAVGTLVGGGFGLLAAALLLVGSLATGPLACWRHLWGAALVATALFNLVAYVDAEYFGAREGWFLPFVQKLATPLLVLWMVATLREVRRAGLSRGRPRPASS